MKPCNHDSRPLYEKLIDPLRDTARSLGYALVVHGTLKRDIDLVAVPWTREAVEPLRLARAIEQTARAHNHGVAHQTPIEAADEWHQLGCPGMKPHGRLVWSFHLGGGPYIDLSVTPRVLGDEPFVLPDHEQAEPGNSP